MHRRFRQVCTALKEHSYLSYAKIASASGRCSSDINLIIIKATAPDDLPVHEKYIHHLLKLFCMSPSSCHSFALSFTRRFGTTRCWRVALKCLILLHRLLRSVPGNSPLWSELLWTRSNALISLYPCRFRDDSSLSCSVSYTKFIISYAQLLDEALNCAFLDNTKLEKQHPQQEEEVEEEKEAGFITMPEAETLQEKMKEMREKLELLPQLQSIIDRVMECCPMGLAARSFIVQTAMKLIIRDSFFCYTKFRKEITVVLDNLFQMPYRNSIAAFNIYKKASVQSNQLYEFYEWCKAKGLCGYYEYPLVEPIPHIQIEALETFLCGMWQLTDQSSSSQTWSFSSSSSSSSSEESPSVSSEGERQVMMRRDVDVNNKGQKLFEDEEEKPLIGLEDDSWETLLDTSVCFSHTFDKSDMCTFFSSKENNQWGLESGFDNGQRFDGKEGHESAHDSWKITTYKTPAADAAYNPFCQPNEDYSNHYRKFGHDPNSYPWGL